MSGFDPNNSHHTQPRPKATTDILALSGNLTAAVADRFHCQTLLFSSRRAAAGHHRDKPLATQLLGRRGVTRLATVPHPGRDARAPTSPPR
jgi:hypothetical protein